MEFYHCNLYALMKNRCLRAWPNLLTFVDAINTFNTSLIHARYIELFLQTIAGGRQKLSTGNVLSLTMKSFLNGKFIDLYSDPFTWIKFVLFRARCELNDLVLYIVIFCRKFPEDNDTLF